MKKRGERTPSPLGVDSAKYFPEAKYQDTNDCRTRTSSDPITNARKMIAASDAASSKPKIMKFVPTEKSVALSPRRPVVPVKCANCRQIHWVD